MTMDRIYRRVVKAAQTTKLPGIEQTMWYGTPSLTVKGRSFMRVKDADTFVFRCALEEKEVLMEAAAKIYFETDHYKGWPAVLVRATEVSDAELAQCVARAWRLLAPKKLLKEADLAAQDPPPPVKKKSRARKKKR
jgi:hypothetical protein